MRELFVYYRVRQDAQAAARDVVERFQDALRAAHPGLITRLLQRPAAADESPTWMETYALPSQPSGVTTQIEKAIETQAIALQVLLEGRRRTEVFLSSNP